MLNSLLRIRTLQKLCIITILLLLPVIQLGYSYYISWQVLGALLLLPFIGVRTFLKNLHIGVFLFVLMELSVFLLPIRDFTYPFLNVGRQFLLFFLLYLLLKKIPRMNDYYGKWVERIIIAEIIFVSVLVILQFIGFPYRSLYFLPADYFIAGQNTVPGALNFRYSNVRPTGTFAEPSYLGFFIMSLYVVILTRVREGRLKWFLVFLSFLVVLLAQTVAGLTAFFFLSVNFLLTRSGKNMTKMILAANLGLVLLFILFEAFDVFNFLGNNVLLFSRISSIVNDSSAYGRLIAPWALLQQAMRENIFGVPLTQLKTNFYADPFARVSGMDNGLMNLFIAFGLTAFPILFFILRTIWRDSLLITYFFLVVMFNGAVFSFDKIIVIGVVILLSGIRLRKNGNYEY